MFVRVHFLCFFFYIQKRRIIRPSAKLTESQRSLPRDWSTTWLHPNLFLFRTIPSLLSYSSLSQSYYEIALRLFSSSSSNEIPAISSSVSSTEIHHDRPASSRASASFPPFHFPTVSLPPVSYNGSRFTSFTSYFHWLRSNWQKPVK